MSYFHFDSSMKLSHFIPANGEWLAMMWNGNYDYYTSPVAMWAICEDEYGSIRIFGVIGDNDIGGEFLIVGRDGDEFIGYIEPGGEAPDEDEIRLRIDIIRKMLEEHKSDAKRGQ